MKVFELKRHWLSACAAVLVACGGSGEQAPAGGGPGGGGNPAPPAPVIQSVAVTPATATLKPGQTMHFTAVASDAGGNAVVGAVFTWSTSNAAVATIDNAGVATGVTVGTVTVSASVAGVTGNSATLAVIAVPVSEASSDALIDAALAAGQIDAETALTYKVFAFFVDPRLPAQFAGNGSGGSGEARAFEQLFDTFDSLSPATQATLSPFLRRPSEVGSWRDPAVRTAAAMREHAQAREKPLGRPICNGVLSTWNFVDTPTAPVRVWWDNAYPPDGVVANKVAGYVEHDVWPTLINTLTFPRPLSDANGGNCDGGDDRIDVYIVVVADQGQTIPSRLAFRPTSAAVYININPNLNDPQLMHAISHEMGHAINWAYTTQTAQTSYGWFRDAFANWAADQVYSGNSALNDMASCHLKSPHLSVDDDTPGYCTGLPKLSRNYGAYLFLQFISKTAGLAKIKEILLALAGHNTALAAIDSVLSGDGLRDWWPRYARKLWNQDPVLANDAPATFNGWDQLANATVNKPVLSPDKPNKTPAGVNGGIERTETMTNQLQNMSVRYYHYTFDPADQFTRSIMFHNGFYLNYKSDQAVTVRAFYKVEGQPWEEEDWTNFEYIGFCRDAKAQRLEELVVMFASGEWQFNSPTVVTNRPPRLMRNVVGCWSFKGTAFRYENLASSKRGTITASFDATFDTHTGPGLPNQLTDEGLGLKRVPIAAPLFTGGSWRLLEDYAVGDCRYKIDSGGSNGSITTGGQSVGLIVVNNFNESLPPDVWQEKQKATGTVATAYVGVGLTTTPVTGSVTGGDTCGTKYESLVGPWWITSEPARSAIGVDGKMKDSYDVPGLTGGDAIKYTWDLTPMRE